jgi:exodeoxyribonuclease VII large subunit
LVSQQRLRVSSAAQRLQMSTLFALKQSQLDLAQLQSRFPDAFKRDVTRREERLQGAARHLSLLDPRLVLQRGFAWLTGPEGRAISSVKQTYSGQALHATLADGTVDLTVTGMR